MYLLSNNSIVDEVTKKHWMNYVVSRLSEVYLCYLTGKIESGRTTLRHFKLSLQPPTSTAHHPIPSQFTQNIMNMNIFSKLSKAIPPQSAIAGTLKRAISALQSENILARDALIPKNDCTSQGLATDPTNVHPQNIQLEYVRAGWAARSANNWGIDAASPNTRLNPEDRTSGNPEGIGMLEQVGSASGTEAFFRAGGVQGQGFLHMK